MSAELTPEIDYYRNHTALKVSDLRKSLQFYRDDMGLPVVLWVGSQEEPRTVFLAGLQLSAAPKVASDNPLASFDHFGLCVQNLEDICARLDQLGHVPLVPLEVRDLPGTGHTVKIAMYSDPDGNRVELFRLE